MELIGKPVKIFFNDLRGVSFREGILKSVTDNALFLTTAEGVEVIALAMFVRIIQLKHGGI